MALLSFFIIFIRFLGDLYVKIMEEHIVGFYNPLRK